MPLNMLVLAVDDLPSPWTREDGFDGKYVRCVAEASHGSTGGANAHRHITAATQSGYCGDASVKTGFVNNVLQDHRHDIDATYSEYENNDPVYATLSLWKIDYSTWYDEYRLLPENAVVLSVQSISSTGYTRWTDADDRLIKLGNPGSTGGRTSHVHADNELTLVSGGASRMVEGGSGATASNPANHSHTCYVDTDSKSILPPHIKTRLYSVGSTTTEVPAGVVVFFDGEPDTIWDEVTTWAGLFVMGANSDPTSAGDTDHGHVGSGTTPGYSPSSISTAPDAYWSNSAPRPHDHSVSVTFSDEDCDPEYVGLVPYELTESLEPDLAVEVSETMDVSARFKKQIAESVDVSARFKKQIAESVDVSARFKKQIAESVDVSTIIVTGREEPVDASVRFKKQIERPEDVSARFKKQIAEPVDASVRFKKQIAESVDASVRFKKQIERPEDVSARFKKQIGSQMNVSGRIRRQILKGHRVSVLIARHATRPRTVFPLRRGVVVPASKEYRQHDGFRPFVTTTERYPPKKETLKRR